MLYRPLSEREITVLKLRAEGFTNVQIADQLFVTENTIKTTVRSILDKLAKSRMESVIYFAAKEGII